MDYEFYKVAHLLGLVLLYTAIGGMAFGRKGGQGKAPAMVTISHGIGLVLLLVAGFGMAARLGHSVLAWWLLVKICIWIVLGAMPVLIRKNVLSGTLGFLLSIALAFAAFWVVNYGRHMV